MKHFQVGGKHQTVSVTSTNTDKAGDHAHWQALTANHKAAYEAMVAEVGKYAGGATHSLVFTPTWKCFIPANC